MLPERLPPNDTSAEEAVIGSILVDEEAILKVANFLNPEDFYREKNQWAYEACLNLFNRGEAANEITVAHELSRQERLEAAGGPVYLSHLVSIVPPSIHIEYYGRIVHRLSMMRRLISAAGQIAAIGYEAGPDLDESLSKAEDVLFRLRRSDAPRDFVPIRDVIDQYFEESSFSPTPTEGNLISIPTGFVDMDKILGGLQRADMVVLAARPSLGKTSLALNIARNAALDHGARVAIFSLEMSKMELAHRFLSREAGVDAQRLRLDQLNDEQRDAIMKAMGALSEAAIFIDDSAVLRDTDMRAKARRLALEKGVDLIIVDYLQLMRSSRRTEDQVQEMSEISRSIKVLARDLDVPVIAISQLSRAAEIRPDHRPVLSDLRQSGSIEQDADVVMFIYREDVYFTREQWEKQNPTQKYPEGIAEIIIAKHRNGPTGRLQLVFRNRTARFDSMAPQAIAERRVNA
ncbi:MAG: replicative DNA helicase [Chloroflexi bacterium]|nr:replicative DNA helicase [Chloroflexota bacterium]